MFLALVTTFWVARLQATYCVNIFTYFVFRLPSLYDGHLFTTPSVHFYKMF